MRGLGWNRRKGGDEDRNRVTLSVRMRLSVSVRFRVQVLISGQERL